MPSRISHLYPLLVCLFLLDSVVPVKICRGGMGILYPQNSNCYYLLTARKIYTTAQAQCMSLNGNLVSILNQEEDDFLKDNFTSPFWIGLTDMSVEDTFRWEDGDMLLQSSSYNNWFAGWTQENDASNDCVNYGEDKTWHVQPCNFNYAPLCEFSSCESNDRMHCVGEEPPTAAASFSIIPIVAVVIVLVIIVIVVVVVVLLMFYLYKRHNDLWKRFCFCLAFSKEKQKVHGLEHENFRLRKELNNLKHQSINLGGSQSLNKPSFISSIPDGQGGMLPSIRPKIHSTHSSSSFLAPQTLPVPPPSDPTKPGPPPLTQNTSLLQSSLNVPSRTPSVIPTPFPQPNMNSSISSEQIAGILWSQKSDYQSQKKAPLNLPQSQFPSRSLFQSPFPTASTPFSFPANSNQITSPSPDVPQLMNKPTKEEEELKADTKQSDHDANLTDAPGIVQ